MIERYADVFRNAGLHYTESFTSLYETSTPDLSALEPLVGTKTGKWIGIAPFAKHRGKIYPTGEMELVMAELSDREDFTIFLFGGRGYEEALLDQWAFEYPRVKSVALPWSVPGCFPFGALPIPMPDFTDIIRIRKIVSSWTYLAVLVPYSAKSPACGRIGRV